MSRGRTADTISLMRNRNTSRATIPASTVMVIDVLLSETGMRFRPARAGRLGEGDPLRGR
nr:hypothetical protein GCM10020092_054020 [Actinoplanes digitatis]